MIAGHDQLRAGQGIQEGPGLAELPGARPLCEIPGDGDEVRIEAPDEGEHGGHDARIRPSEMDIREMEDAAHVLDYHTLTVDGRYAVNG